MCNERKITTISENLKIKYALDDDISEIEKRIEKVIANDEQPAKFEELAEYFSKALDEDGVIMTFDELINLLEMFAEEELHYCNTPKSYTYARYIAGLITSIADDNDQARAISFLEDPENPFEEWKQ